MVLCTTAVGKSYNNILLEFLKSRFSKEFNIFILTDRPELYPSYNTDLYYKLTFNYFDKITYGINIVNRIKEPGFIVDSDDLLNFENLYSKFDTSSNMVQYLQHWNKEGTLNTILPEHEHFWEFMNDYLLKENISNKDIYMILEKVFFLPKRNYSNFLKYFESLRYNFEKNSRENGMHKNGVGNGEGVAFGYALLKSKIKHKKVAS